MIRSDGHTPTHRESPRKTETLTQGLTVRTMWFFDILISHLRMTSQNISQLFAAWSPTLNVFTVAVTNLSRSQSGLSFEKQTHLKLPIELRSKVRRFSLFVLQRSLTKFEVNKVGEQQSISQSITPSLYTVYVGSILRDKSRLACFKSEKKKKKRTSKYVSPEDC